MSGRIFGYLLICDPPYQTAAQLTEALGVSKGSVSTMVRYLIQTGWVERFTVAGERSAYYRLRLGAPRDVFDVLMKGVVRMKTMTERGLALLPEDKPEIRERCQNLNDIYVFLVQKFNDLIDSVERGDIEIGSDSK